MNSLISNIKTGPFEIISSGIVQVLEDELTTLIFDSISILFQFEIDQTDSTSRIGVNATEQTGIKFVLTNINMPSYGTTEFVKFASQNDGSDLYISFRIHSLNDKKVRSLEYSIYKKNV